jgi:hypothetical protein
MAVPSVTSSAFVLELPNIIDAAEQRCYREVDLLDVRIVDTSANLTASSRTFTLPSSIGRFLAVEQFSVVTPFGTTLTTGGTRVPLYPVSPDSLDNLWPSEAASGVPSIPEFYAPITSQIYRVGPSPDAAYNVEVKGTARPAPLSSGNATTLLTLYLPDLFFAASMKIAAAYQKNFGASADDPKMASSWEAEYQVEVASAITEEFRKKFGGSGWSPMATPPEAQPARN